MPVQLEKPVPHMFDVFRCKHSACTVSELMQCNDDLLHRVPFACHNFTMMVVQMTRCPNRSLATDPREGLLGHCIMCTALNGKPYPSKANGTGHLGIATAIVLELQRR